jgi:WXXGXW repeat (2 copies)
MKKKLLALTMLVGGSLFAETHFFIGVGIGTPGYYAPAPRPVVAVRPPCPGPDYTWVDGYWAPNRVWVAGYWAPPVYRGSSWVASRNDDRHYYEGHGRLDRDGDGDRDRDREWNRGRGYADGRR